MFGIALPVISRGFYSAQNIIDMYIKVAEQGDGAVYFSTDNRVLLAKGQQVECVLLVNREFKFVADIISFEQFAEKSRPADAEKYSPPIFKYDHKKNWFLLRNFKEVGTKELKEFQMVGRSKDVASYLEETKRLQVFYFHTQTV